MSKNNHSNIIGKNLIIKWRKFKPVKLFSFSMDKLFVNLNVQKIILNTFLKDFNIYLNLFHNPNIRTLINNLKFNTLLIITLMIRRFKTFYASLVIKNILLIEKLYFIHCQNIWFYILQDSKNHIFHIKKIMPIFSSIKICN